MRIFEIILKLLFVLGSAYSIKAEAVPYTFLISYIVVCAVLGIVLILNKKQSYGYPLAKHEIIIRRIEGILLISFSVFVFYFQG